MSLMSKRYSFRQHFRRDFRVRWRHGAFAR
jgi:hypothetical protein